MQTDKTNNLISFGMKYLIILSKTEFSVAIRAIKPIKIAATTTAILKPSRMYSPNTTKKALLLSVS